MPKESMRSDDGSLGSVYWAGALYLVVAVVVVLALVAAVPPDRPTAPPPSHHVEIRELARQGAIAVQHWQRFVARLCREPELNALGLAPDCETGVISLSTDEFFEPEGFALRADARARLRTAVSVLLGELRSDEQVWSQIEGIEVRGHADPNAVRDPYETNLFTSQQRASTVLLFLSSSLTGRDRDDLQRLAVVSGASHSRPARDCHERSQRCDALARRVEIRIALDASDLREASGLFERVDALAAPSAD